MSDDDDDDENSKGERENDEPHITLCLLQSNFTYVPLNLTN